MILYFSATGNSKFTAEKIAQAIGDKAISVESLSCEISISNNEVLGIVSPVHFQQLPIVVKEFLDKTKITVANGAYVFLVATYGTMSGFIAEQTKRLLSNKGIHLAASFSVCMPDVWTPIFDLTNKNKIKQSIESAKTEIDIISQKISVREKGNHTKHRIPYFSHIILDKVFKNARQTKNLFVEKSCIACGLCESHCPVNAIKITDGRPVWQPDHCSMCLRCLHHCPKFAIQYGNGKTKSHGQYICPA